MSDRSLAARVDDARALIALLALKHAPGAADVLKLVRDWTPYLNRALRHPLGGASLAEWVRYILLVNDGIDVRRMRDVLSSSVGSEAGDLSMTAGLRLIEKGMRRVLRHGLQQGLEQGLAQGREDGERALLIRLLEQRFGALDPAQRTRVDDASTDLVWTWSQRLLDAKTIEDVFA